MGNVVMELAWSWFYTIVPIPDTVTADPGNALIVWGILGNTEISNILCAPL
jgi:hypothetical protein